VYLLDPGKYFEVTRGNRHLVANGSQNCLAYATIAMYLVAVLD
jgi:hypothetical protein